jgi:hypothetical protein
MDYNSMNIFLKDLEKYFLGAECQPPTPAILSTQEAEIRRIVV